MKKMIRPVLIVFLAAVLVTVSCEFPGGMPGGGGNLTVVLPGGNGAALSVLSNAAISALRYHITLAGPGGTIEREAAGGSVIVAVEPGKWTVTVDAYDAANTLVGTGVETTTVAVGQPASVSIKMAPASAYIAANGIYIHSEAELRRYLDDYGTVSGVTFYLENDITVNGGPVGNISSTTATLDGQGHTVTLNIDATGDQVGLLAQNSGTVKNLKLTGTVTGTYASNTSAAGAVAGMNVGIIEKVSSTVEVEASNTTSGTAALYTGGIAGENSGTIRDCSTGGTVDASRTIGGGDTDTGGIAGRNSGAIERCYAWGMVISNVPAGPTGGIVGYNGSSTVQRCAALNSKVDNTGTGSDLGRIAGQNSGTGLLNNYAYEGMQIGSATSPVSGGTATNSNGAILTDTELAASGAGTVWSPAGSKLEWLPIITGSPSASEPLGVSPWWWGSAITIDENTVNLGPVWPVRVPILWFEMPPS
jgi:hypothetical protein